MPYIGHHDDIDWKDKPAGTYYHVKDTGEVFDSERDIDEYGWEWTPDEPKSGEPEFYYSWQEFEEAGYEESDGEWMQPDWIEFEQIQIPETFVAMNWVNEYEDTDDEDTVHWDVTATTVEGGGTFHSEDEWDGGETLNESIEIAKDKAKELSALPEYENHLFAVGYDTLFAGHDDSIAFYRNGKKD